MPRNTAAGEEERENSITLRLLEKQGLNTDTLQLLINDSLETRQKPTAWLMAPSSLSIH